jgi:hypothetical protein
MSDPWQNEEVPAPQRRGLSPGGIAGLATGFVVLALTGATIGWIAAGPNPTDLPQSLNSASVPSVTVTPSVTGTAADASPTPAVSASASPVPSESPRGTLPTLTGTDFRDARKFLRAQQVNVALKFDDTPDGTSKVTSTNPVAGTALAKGITVVLTVSGAAPLIPNSELPNVGNTPCSAVGSSLAAAGLTVAGYVGIKTAWVRSIQPPLNDLHWNQAVTVSCGPQESPSPAAGG